MTTSCFVLVIFQMSFYDNCNCDEMDERENHFLSRWWKKAQCKKNQLQKEWDEWALLKQDLYALCGCFSLVCLNLKWIRLNKGWWWFRWEGSGIKCIKMYLQERNYQWESSDFTIGDVFGLHTMKYSWQMYMSTQFWHTINVLMHNTFPICTWLCH